MLFFDGKWVHFIGVGGVGVNALALCVMDLGGRVSGSDQHLSPLAKALSDKGASVWQGENVEKMMMADIVVFSSAIKDNNQELIYAKEHGKKVYERGEFLGEIASYFGTVVGIAGTHGKSTTTSMLTHVLLCANRKMASFIGAESEEFANYVNNYKDCDILDDCIFVAEACEYKQSLLHLKCDIALVTSIDLDHPDCYTTIQDISKTYNEFLSMAKYALTLDDCIAMTHARFEGNDCLVEDTKIEIINNTRYNQENAVCVIAIAKLLGIEQKDCITYLASYKGVKRRYERAKDIKGVPCYFDFAHHPKEIESVLSHDFHRGLVVFQPHTYSRTKAYLDGFVKALTNKKIASLIIMPTYPAREKESDGITSKDLFLAISKCNPDCDLYYLLSNEKIVNCVKSNAKLHDIILFIGAGDIYNLKEKL